ncbi:hypothetical protein [Thermococcus sp.]
MKEVDHCIGEVKEILPGTYRIRVSGKTEPPEVLYPVVREWERH